MLPEDLLYTEEHEWVRREGAGDDGPSDTVVRIGITDFAQDQLGDIVYVSLPEVGAEIAAGDSVGELESTKSVSDVYAPLQGVVSAVNEALDAQPELVNSDPYGEGWLFELRPADPGALESLLDAAAYEAHTRA